MFEISHNFEQGRASDYWHMSRHISCGHPEECPTQKRNSGPLRINRPVRPGTLICVREALGRVKALALDEWRCHARRGFIFKSAIETRPSSMPLTIRLPAKKKHGRPSFGLRSFGADTHLAPAERSRRRVALISRRDCAREICVEIFDAGD
ncbi:unnamed protein product, partial [Iphiclides podalirius]